MDIKTYFITTFSPAQIMRSAFWAAIWITGVSSLNAQTTRQETIATATYETPCDCPGGAPDCCPKCNLEIKKEAVKKHFYRVECKTICIPRVTCPWEKPSQKSCTGSCDSGDCQCPVPCKGARIRKVKVMRKYEYECEKCKYKWTPTCLTSDCTSPSGQPDSTAGEKFAPPVPTITDRAARLLNVFDAIPLWK